MVSLDLDLSMQPRAALLMVDGISLLEKCGGRPRDGHSPEGTMVSGVGG